MVCQNRTHRFRGRSTRGACGIAMEANPDVFLLLAAPLRFPLMLLNSTLDCPLRARPQLNHDAVMEVLAWVGDWAAFWRSASECTGSEYSLDQWPRTDAPTVTAAYLECSRQDTAPLSVSPLSLGHVGPVLAQGIPSLGISPAPATKSCGGGGWCRAGAFGTSLQDGDICVNGFLQGAGGDTWIGLSTPSRMVFLRSRVPLAVQEMLTMHFNMTFVFAICLGTAARTCSKTIGLRCRRVRSEQKASVVAVGQVKALVAMMYIVSLATCWLYLYNGLMLQTLHEGDSVPFSFLDFAFFRQLRDGLEEPASVLFADAILPFSPLMLPLYMGLSPRAAMEDARMIVPLLRKVACRGPRVRKVEVTTAFCRFLHLVVMLFCLSYLLQLLIRNIYHGFSEAADRVLDRLVLAIWYGLWLCAARLLCVWLILAMTRRSDAQGRRQLLQSLCHYTLAQVLIVFQRLWGGMRIAKTLGTSMGTLGNGSGSQDLDLSSMLRLQVLGLPHLRIASLLSIPRFDLSLPDLRAVHDWTWVLVVAFSLLDGLLQPRDAEGLCTEASCHGLLAWIESLGAIFLDLDAGTVEEGRGHIEQIHGLWCSGRRFWWIRHLAGDKLLLRELVPWRIGMAVPLERTLGRRQWQQQDGETQITPISGKELFLLQGGTSCLLEPGASQLGAGILSLLLTLLGAMSQEAALTATGLCSCVLSAALPCFPVLWLPLWSVLMMVNVAASPVAALPASANGRNLMAVMSLVLLGGDLLLYLEDALLQSHKLRGSGRRTQRARWLFCFVLWASLGPSSLGAVLPSLWVLLSSMLADSYYHICTMASLKSVADLVQEEGKQLLQVELKENGWVLEDGAFLEHMMTSSTPDALTLLLQSSIPAMIELLITPDYPAQVRAGHMQLDEGVNYNTVVFQERNTPGRSLHISQAEGFQCTTDLINECLLFLRTNLPWYRPLRVSVSKLQGALEFLELFHLDYPPALEQGKKQVRNLRVAVRPRGDLSLNKWSVYFINKNLDILLLERFGRGRQRPSMFVADWTV